MRKIDKGALALLRQQSWPGNVRELRNTMYRLILMARDDVIDAHCVSDILLEATPEITSGQPGSFGRVVNDWIRASNPASGGIYHAALSAFEKPLFEWALRQTGGNQLQAAKLLGINRNTLRKRIVDLGIEPDQLTA